MLHSRIACWDRVAGSIRGARALYVERHGSQEKSQRKDHARRRGQLCKLGHIICVGRVPSQHRCPDTARPVGQDCTAVCAFFLANNVSGRG